LMSIHNISIVALPETIIKKLTLTVKKIELFEYV